MIDLENCDRFLTLPVTLSSRLVVSSSRNNVKFPVYFLQDQKTAQEICAEFGLNDVELEYAEEDFKIMTNYKVFSQQIRPLIAAENPKIPMSKVVMLIGAKWREFLTLNPNKDSIEAVEREAAKQAAAAVASGGQIEPLTEADADVADVTAPTDGKWSGIGVQRSNPGWDEEGFDSSISWGNHQNRHCLLFVCRLIGEVT